MLSWLKAAGKRTEVFFHSIRFRLTLWSVAILAVILLVFCAFVYSRQTQDVKLATENQLAVKAQQFEDLFRFAGLFGPDGLHISNSDLTQREGMILQPGDVMALVGPNGQILQKGGQFSDATINQLTQDWQNTGQVNQIISEPARLALPSNPDKKVDGLYLVDPILVERHLLGLLIIGQPVDPQGQLPRLIFTLLLASLATLGLVVAGGYWLAGRALAPVRTITRTARGISETDLHRRLRLNTQDELGELANTFDAMLDRLQAAFDRQRQFTADASHELRTPLTIVGLETEHALSRRRPADEYERALRVIKGENEYMAQLVNDLLTLARMDAGQAKLKMEPLDLSDISLDVVERLSPLARRDGVEMVTGELPEIRIQGDRQYLTQMMTNLVENALKYAAIGGRHVWVETGCVSANGKDYGWARVADDGPGIPAEHLPHLFDRFYRVDQARTREESADSAEDEEKKPQGSGLGLSIVQWIIQAHGGQVSVQSEVGKGTVFEVRLPLAG